MFRWIVRRVGHLLRAIGRELAATVRSGGPIVAASAPGDQQIPSGNAPIGVVVGLTALEASNGEPPPSDEPKSS